MNDQLKTIFSNINDWLKFAEAKNAGLLALNVACIVGILRGQTAFESSMKPFEGSMLMFFCISASMCIYSILPVLNKLFRLYKKLSAEEFEKQQDKINILYFGDIAKLSKAQFAELFIKKTEATLKPIDNDLIAQISNNAEIAWQKYKVFNVAAIITFSSFVAGFILVLISAVGK